MIMLNSRIKYNQKIFLKKVIINYVWKIWEIRSIKILKIKINTKREIVLITLILYKNNKPLKKVKLYVVFI
jgi:hypothetical protein